MQRRDCNRRFKLVLNIIKAAHGPATGRHLESARSLPIGTIASRWPGTDAVSGSNTSLRESRATNLPS